MMVVSPSVEVGVGTTSQDRIIDFRVKLTATAEQRTVELSPANDGSLPSRW